VFSLSDASGLGEDLRVAGKTGGCRLTGKHGGRPSFFYTRSRGTVARMLALAHRMQTKSGGMISGTHQGFARRQGSDLSPAYYACVEKFCHRGKIILGQGDSEKQVLHARARGVRSSTFFLTGEWGGSCARGLKAELHQVMNSGASVRRARYPGSASPRESLRVLSLRQS
jgi:hypothetical protein